METTTFAFGMPTDNLHAPNEHFQMDAFWLARSAWVHLLVDLGAAARAHPEGAPQDEGAGHSEL